MKGGKSETEGKGERSRVVGRERDGLESDVETERNEMRHIETAGRKREGRKREDVHQVGREELWREGRRTLEGKGGGRH